MQSSLNVLSHPDEQMYRCEDCDELFSSKLELRRHQKYSCNTGSSLFDSLSEDLKQERDDNDEPVHECKDCEKIFPSEYRSVSYTIRMLPKKATKLLISRFSLMFS